MKNLFIIYEDNSYHLESYWLNLKVIFKLFSEKIKWWKWSRNLIFKIEDFSFSLNFLSLGPFSFSNECHVLFLFFMQKSNRLMYHSLMKWTRDVGGLADPSFTSSREFFALFLSSYIKNFNVVFTLISSVVSKSKLNL